MILAILAHFKGRIVRLRDAAGRSFDSLRQAFARRLAAAHAAAAAGLDRSVDRARDLAGRVCRAFGPRARVAVDLVGCVIHGPDALPHLALSFVALLILAAAADPIGLPWPLLSRSAKVF